MLKDLVDFDEITKDWREKYYKIIDEFFLRASDRVLFYDLVENKKFRKALEKDLTKRFFEDFEFATKLNQSYCYCIIGKRGRGKTTLMRIIQIKTKEKHPKSEIPQVFNKSEVLNVLFEIYKKMGSSIGLDEPLTLTGEGSRTIKVNFENVLQICREYSINFIFNMKEFLNVENVDIYLMLFGFDKENNKTRCIWLNDKGEPMGLVYFEKNFKDEDFQHLKQRKDEKWLELVENKGKQGTTNLDDEKQKITQLIFDNGLEKGFEDKLDLKYYLTTKHTFTTREVNMLSKQIWKVIKKKKEESKLKNSKEYNPIGFSVKDFELIHIEKVENDFVRDIINSQVKINDLEREVLHLNLVKGESYKNIIKRVKNKAFAYPFQFGKLYKRIAKELGITTEMKIANLKKDWEHLGMYSDKPDFLNHQENQVLSFKTVMNKRYILSYIYEININEYMYAKQHNYDLIYLVCCLKEKELYYYKYMGFGNNG